MNAVVELSPSLQRWRDWLGWFDLSLAESLGDLVRRLADLAGPVNARSGRAAVEPDGLGDLRSRGPYERLLTTEWLLADELPEEFLRRAAASEHLFLAPSLKAQPSDRAVVALFDAGPRQLGAPRLAHLAAWVLLARRASELGGQLRWGIVQKPGELFDAQDSGALRSLMRARTLLPATGEMREAWRAALGPAGAETAGGVGTAAPGSPSKAEREPRDLSDAELWWIGAPSPEFATPAGRERVLALRLPLEPGLLNVAYAAAGVTRAVSLPLPAGDESARLLRGDFLTRPPTAPGAEAAGTARRAPPRGKAPAMALSMAPSLSRFGGHVMVESVPAAHAMLVFSVPGKGTSPRVQRREYKWSPASEPLATAITGMTGCGLMVRKDEREVQGWNIPDFRRRTYLPREPFHVVPDTARRLPLVVLRSRDEQAVVAVDANRYLSFWPATPEDARTPFRVIAQDVLSLTALTPTSAAVVNHRDGQLWMWEVSVGKEARNGIALMQREQVPQRVLVAHRRGHGLDVALPVGVAARTSKSSPETWSLRWCSPTLDLFSHHKLGDMPGAELTLAPGARAVGLAAAHEEVSPALIVLGEGRRTLSRVSLGGSRALFRSDAEILQVTVCPDSARIALITRERHLLVIDGTDGRVLMMLDDNAPEADR